jgi:hypothetical protein
MLPKYKKNPDYDKSSVHRLYYDSIQRHRHRFTGYVSKNAMKKNANTTYDHFSMPQWIARLILDNDDVYLSDFEKFNDIFKFSLQTIKVTKEENKKLSSQTPVIKKIDGIKTFIEISIKDKYDKAGIMLWSDKEGYVDKFPIPIPQEILDYEEQFLKK